MKIQEGSFCFEMIFERNKQQVLADVYLRIDEVAPEYRDRVRLLTMAQFLEFITQLRQFYEEALEQYSSAFSESRLAVLVEKQEETIQLTWVIAPQTIITDATSAIGIDLLQLEQSAEVEVEKVSQQQQTVEVELELTTREFREILTQLEEDYHKLMVY